MKYGNMPTTESNVSHVFSTLIKHFYLYCIKLKKKIPLG